MLAASITSGGAAGVYVPVKDLLGSTLALVNSANGVATQYTYDPFGNVTASGQNLNYPYQYAGLEYDQTGLYFDGRGYYQPLLGRPLEGYGAPNAPGAGGQGGGAGLPSAAGGGGGGWLTDYENGVAAFDITVASGAAAFAAASAIGVGSEVGITFAIGAHAGAIGLAVAAVTAIVQVVLGAFGIDIFGGGASRPTPLPMQIRFGHYPAGEFIGVLAALFPDMTDSAAVEAAAMFAPPPAVASAAPPSTSGDPSGGHVTLAQFTSGSKTSSPGKNEKCQNQARTNFGNCVSFAKNAMGVVTGLGLGACGLGAAASEGIGLPEAAACATKVLGAASGFGISSTAACYAQLQQQLNNCNK